MELKGERALTGVTVLECSDWIAGPYCAKLMGDLGAAVIKVEDPSGGDVTRRRGPFPRDIPHPEKSGLFLWLNTSKLGVTLNLKTQSGRKLLKELLSRADIVIEDQLPIIARSLQLDYESISEINPQLIVVSITPFGQTGPHASYKAYPLNTFHGGGEGYFTPGGNPYPSRSPVKVGNFVGEYVCAVNGAIATMGALLERTLTGKGCHIDVSKQEVLMRQNVLEMLRFVNEGFLTNRDTKGWLAIGCFKCKDGYVDTNVQEPREWDAFVEIMGNPAWATDPELKKRVVREQRGEEVRKGIEEALANRSKEELYEEALRLRCPLAPYNNIGEAMSSPQFRHRGFFVEMEHAAAGKFEYPSVPYQFSKTPVRMGHPAPLLGEHNEEVFCKLLNHAPRELVRWRQAGVI